MRANEFLNESLTSNIPYKIVNADNNAFSTIAWFDSSRSVTFNANSMEVFGKPDHWEVEFYEEKLGKRGLTFAKTGSGSELQVFSFVIKSLTEMIERYNPEVIRFGSDKSDENRTRLYKRMVDRFAPKLGYELDRLLSRTRDDMFVIKRKNRG